MLALNEENLLDSEWEVQNASRHHLDAENVCHGAVKHPEKARRAVSAGARKNLQNLRVNFVNFSKLSALRTLLCQKST